MCEAAQRLGTLLPTRKHTQQPRLIRTYIIPPAKNRWLPRPCELAVTNRLGNSVPRQMTPVVLRKHEKRMRYIRSGIL